MRLMRSVLLLALMMTLSQPLWAQKIGEVKTRTKSLGDINGDGHAEQAVARTFGGSSMFTDVAIISGSKTLLKVPTFCGDTADGYAVVGKEIVVWRGDWSTTTSKWKPHYYNFSWYGWSSKAKRLVIEREGYTRKAYSYSDAAKTMPKFARKPGAALVQSQGATFASDAGHAASKKYGKPLWSVREYPSAKDARYYFVELAGKKGASFDVEVRFQRNGQVRVVSMNEQSF